MSNIQYNELIKARLLEEGYPPSNIDLVTSHIIQIADDREVNAMVLLDEFVIKGKSIKTDRDMSRSINQFGNGMAFSSYRHSTPKPNRFVGRQIIN